MKLILSKENAWPHTTQEFMEDYAPEIWQAAIVAADKLRDQQLSVVQQLLDAKRNLPTSIEHCELGQSLVALIYYIELRVMYLLLSSVWKILDEKCEKLAKAYYKKDKTEQDYLLTELETLLSNIADFTKKNLLNKQVEDLLQMELILKKTFQLHDLTPIINSHNTQGAWSLRDITGTIKTMGTYWYKHRTLLIDALNDIDPIEVNIEQLLASNEILRIH